MENKKTEPNIEEPSAELRSVRPHSGFGSWFWMALAVFVVLGGGVWGFAELADEVLEGDTRDFDERIVLMFRNPMDLSDPLGPEWVEEMGRDFTALGGVGVLTALTLSVIGYLLLIQKRQTALTVVLAIGSGILVSLLLKHGFDRPRPDLVPHASHAYTSSFPSGHSMMSAICYLTLATLLASVRKTRRVKIYLISLAALITFAVGLSRVYMGVHWPTDVLGGWLAGSVWALAAWLVSHWRKSYHFRGTWGRS